jgi:hypothetical protein
VFAHCPAAAPSVAEAGQRKNRISDMVNISERSADAEDPAVPGHWEDDLIIAKPTHSAINTLVERSTACTMLVHLPTATSPAAVPACQHKRQLHESVATSCRTMIIGDARRRVPIRLDEARVALKRSAMPMSGVCISRVGRLTCEKTPAAPSGPYAQAARQAAVCWTNCLRMSTSIWCQSSR